MNESFSRAQLSQAILGLSRSAEDQLIDERRNLEEEGHNEPLQRLLFCFEQLCDVVSAAGYHSDGDENDIEFFVNLFPVWLLRLNEWAISEKYLDLSSAAGSARKIYLPIAHQIVPAAQSPR